MPLRYAIIKVPLVGLLVVLSNVIKTHFLLCYPTPPSTACYVLFFAIPWITNTLEATISAIQRIFTNLWSRCSLSNYYLLMKKSRESLVGNRHFVYCYCPYLRNGIKNEKFERDAALGEAYFERRISFSTPTVSIVSLLESKNKQTSCVAAMALIISAF